MGMPPLAGWVSPLPGHLYARGLHVLSSHFLSGAQCSEQLSAWAHAVHSLGC